MLFVVPILMMVGVVFFLGIGRFLQGVPNPVRPGFLLVWGGLTLGVGYSYVVLIAAGFAVAKSVGWIVPVSIGEGHPRNP